MGNKQADELDRLLARSPNIADRGFTKIIQQHISRKQTKRMGVFATAAASWIVAALVLNSPQQLLQPLIEIGTFWIQLANLEALSSISALLNAPPTSNDIIQMAAFVVASISLSSLLRIKN